MIETALKTLSCESLYKNFGRRRVLSDVSFHAKSNEVIGILGPNGAGKTTAFKSMLGLVIPDKGNILLNGKNITKLPVHLRAQKGIAYLPQDISIFRGLKVIENLRIILKLNNHEMSKKEIDEKANELLEEFGIDHLKNQNSDYISGGEKRRLEFARTLTLSPSFILLDEPFVGIDPITVKDIQKIIRNLKNKGIGVIVTDHDVQSISMVVDKLYVLYKGKVISCGNPDEVLSNKEVIENYLGDED